MILQDTNLTGEYSLSISFNNHPSEIVVYKKKIPQNNIYDTHFDFLVQIDNIHTVACIHFVYVRMFPQPLLALNFISYNPDNIVVSFFMTYVSDLKLILLKYI